MRNVATLARYEVGFVARVRYILLVAAYAERIRRLESAVRVVAFEAFKCRHWCGLRERRIPVAVKATLSGREYPAFLGPLTHRKDVAADA